MSDLLKNIEEHLKNKQFNTREDINNEIKEIFQKIIISELTKTDFFTNNSFHGGTALRLFYNLNRYSKDLDFSLKKQINNFNWNNYYDTIYNNLKFQEIEINYKDESNENINRITIKEDSILKYLDGKGILPEEITKKNTRKKTTVKMETSFSVDNFLSEIKDLVLFNNVYKVDVFDINSLFSGKLNACLTREITDKDTGKKVRDDTGRDWFDFVWYINNKIKPNYDFLSSKLDKSGIINLNKVKADDNLIKKLLLSRIRVLDFDTLNKELYPITRPEDRIVLNEKYLIKMINQIDINS